MEPAPMRNQEIEINGKNGVYLCHDKVVRVDLQLKEGLSTINSALDIPLIMHEILDVKEKVLTTQTPLVTKTLSAERADRLLKIMELGTIPIKENSVIILSARS